MGTIELNKKIMELKELEQFLGDVESEIESLKDELKAELTQRGVDELETGVFTIRWKEYKSSRFDGKLFQKERGDLYEAYKVEKASKRFTIN